MSVFKLTFINFMMCLLALISFGCSSGSNSGARVTASGIDSELTTGEQPVMRVYPVQGAVIEYEQPSVSSQMADRWEVVVTGKETFLNYNYFPFGTDMYNDQPTWVCTAIANQNKYVGAVAENVVRLKKAIVVTAMQQTKSLPQKLKCQKYSDMPEKDLGKIFGSLN